MKARGGARPGAGRKPKSEEQNLIEKLQPFEKEALEALKKAVIEEQGWAIKLYMEYKYGRPKQTLNTNIKVVEQPLFDFDIHSNDSDKKDS
jgi:hypothetical protein